MSSEWMSFEPETPPVGGLVGPAWKLAVVDDDQAVHDGTRFALQNFRLRDRPLELLSAYSAREGRELLRRHPDTAVVLLDVVMESDEAGLELARAIRGELGNDLVRIILRTGQPGQAPEHKIVIDYDINDYKAKTELTADKLYTTLTAALRSFEQLKKLDDMRLGLELIVQASSDLFATRSLERLAQGVLLQLNALLSLESAGILVLRERSCEAPSVLARVGSFSGDKDLDLADLFRRAAENGGAIERDRFVRLYVRTGAGAEILVLLDTERDPDETQAALVRVFCGKLAAAFDNARLHERLARAKDGLERDVAERTALLSAANERLEAQGALLRRVNSFKNEILGTLAHDLKNPLGVILGRAEMLASVAEGLDERQAEPVLGQLAHVRAAAQRMTRIVDLSLADAMEDAMDIAVRPRAVDLTETVRAIGAQNEAAALAKDQTLRVAIAEPLDIECDPDRLGEAIDNLVGNAVKYTPAGGRIELSAGRHPGGAVFVTVADSGPGLAPEDIMRLFGRFQRLSAQPTGGETSTGLGLSIVRKIVDLHGGRVDVLEHGPLGGASFTIVLFPEPVRVP